MCLLHCQCENILDLGVKKILIGIGIVGYFLRTMSAVYAGCTAQYDVDTDLSALLECITSGSEEALKDVQSGIDYFFLVIMGALVYFMQAGFAMLTAGSVRAKNVKNIMLWNLLDSCVAGVAWWLTGYAFAYGGDETGGPVTFIGKTSFLLMDGNVNFAFWFFQFAFAGALSSIVAGTIAERCKMTAYLFFSPFLVGFVYPVICHSLWSPNGWISILATEPLFGSGAIDLAGSGPVHMTGGVTALAAGLVLGPRIGRFYDKDGNPLEEPHTFSPHSVALQALGTFCLWFGWYGFNPGSVLISSNATSGSVVALVAANTTLSACGGAISALFTSSWLDLRATGVITYDLGATMNGCLTGLVGITAGAATVEPWAAVVIGLCSGWVYLFSSYLCIRLKFDDAVDAVPVHLGGGAWGVLATGLFTSPQRLLAFDSNDTYVGWFYEWGRGSANFTLMGCQMIAVLFIFAWTFTLMGIYFWILNWFDLLRVDALEEEVGMDISRHKGSAYDMSGAREKDVEDLNRSRHKAYVDTPKNEEEGLSKEAEKAVEEEKENESVEGDEAQP